MNTDVEEVEGRMELNVPGRDERDLGSGGEHEAADLGAGTGVLPRLGSGPPSTAPSAGIPAPTRPHGRSLFPPRRRPPDGAPAAAGERGVGRTAGHARGGGADGGGPGAGDGGGGAAPRRLPGARGAAGAGSPCRGVRGWGTLGCQTEARTYLVWLLLPPARFSAGRDDTCHR